MARKSPGVYQRWSGSKLGTRLSECPIGGCALGTSPTSNRNAKVLALLWHGVLVCFWSFDVSSQRNSGRWLCSRPRSRVYTHILNKIRVRESESVLRNGVQASLKIWALRPCKVLKVCKMPFLQKEKTKEKCDLPKASKSVTRSGPSHRFSHSPAPRLPAAVLCLC